MPYPYDIKIEVTERPTGADDHKVFWAKPRLVSSFKLV